LIGFALIPECRERSLRRPPPLTCVEGYAAVYAVNGGESMSAARVTCFLAPIHQRRARGWAGRK